MQNIFWTPEECTLILQSSCCWLLQFHLYHLSVLWIFILGVLTHTTAWNWLCTGEGMKHWSDMTRASFWTHSRGEQRKETDVEVEIPSYLNLKFFKFCRFQSYSNYLKFIFLRKPEHLIINFEKTEIWKSINILLFGGLRNILKIWTCLCKRVPNSNYWCRASIILDCYKSWP